MVTTQKPTAKTPAAKTPAKVETPKLETPTPEVSLPTIEAAKPQTPQLPSIEERLKKLDQIIELADRRQLIKEALTNLGGFYISPDGNGANLKLQDSKGRTFGIAHPSVIGEIVSLSKAKLTAELEKIEAQIDFKY